MARTIFNFNSMISRMGKSWKPDWWIYFYKIDSNKATGVKNDITVVKTIDGGAGKKMMLATTLWSDPEDTITKKREEYFTQFTEELKK